MPTYGGYAEHPWDKNPRLWAKVQREVEAEMIRSGWNPKAGKFGEVHRRKCQQAWRKIRH